MQFNVLALMALVASVSAQLSRYCEANGAALPAYRFCDSGNSFCCQGPQNAQFSIYRGNCFSPENVDGEDVTDQCPQGGSYYCCT